ncbi:MAG TPA: hypothetical protein VHH32_06500 [Gemmatimonadales bacterium]|nr:hypothetical protein [Gemmatimonadales bacterium]
MLLVSSCSDSTPVSPVADEPGGTNLNQSSRIVGLYVGHTGWLRRDGIVSVRVEAFCRPGYEVAEAGPLSLTQRQGDREAYGEGFAQVQLGGCSGQWENGIVRVQQFEEPRFRPGSARVSMTFAVVQSSDPDNIQQVSVVKEITIRRVH